MNFLITTAFCGILAANFEIKKVKIYKISLIITRGEVLRDSSNNI